jgi:hypothetical protein
VAIIRKLGLIGIQLPENTRRTVYSSGSCIPINPKLSELYRQFQLLVYYACRGRWEVKYHIADYAKKIKMAPV